jgi:NAD(P)-dependent dehydrogenase (short-subunit alcohol dehydrogenase family)
MLVSGQTALVTGANRGLRRHLAEQLRDRGAKVCAGARRPESVTTEGVTPVRINVTDEESVAAAAAATGDVSTLINNAGASTGTSLLTGEFADIRGELETSYLGPLAVIRAFVPQLAACESSAVVNVLSVPSWISFPAAAAYCAPKSAAWSMTNALRRELAPQGIAVAAPHVAYMDAEMARGVQAAKSDPAEVARILLDGLEAGTPEILADCTSKQVQSLLSGGVPALRAAGLA